MQFRLFDKKNYTIQKVLTIIELMSYLFEKTKWFDS